MASVGGALGYRHRVASPPHSFWRRVEPPSVGETSIVGRFRNLGEDREMLIDSFDGHQEIRLKFLLVIGRISIQVVILARMLTLIPIIINSSIEFSTVILKIKATTKSK